MENGGKLLERQHVVIYAVLKILSLNETNQSKKKKMGIR